MEGLDNLRAVEESLKLKSLCGNVIVAIENIVKDLDLCVEQNYYPPTEIRVNPCTLELFADTAVNLDETHKIDCCIGKRISDKIVVPRVCIDFSDNAAIEHIRKYDEKIRVYKHIHPYIRYGIFITNRQSLNRQLAEDSLIKIDFIEAIKPFIEHPEKLEYHLKDFIREQVSVCDTVLSMVYDNGNVRSIRRNLFF